MGSDPAWVGKTYPTFLHSKGKRTYGPFVVEILNYHQYPSMTSHMVKVMKKLRYDVPLIRTEPKPGKGLSNKLVSCYTAWSIS
ncbi:unnamed protein product [Anisakis simplex]|uniref:Transposase n=1 Tax=Anisakis simplex TaxID=6269 RepID=A0A0M3KHC2_ANISI|nr:unnamed protein product [Anisakis simplex]